MSDRRTPIDVRSAIACLAVVALTTTLITTGCRPPANGAGYQHEATWPMLPSQHGIPAPRSLCVATNGELYALDTVGRVLVYSPSGELARHWRMPDVSVGRPEGIIQLRDGSILVTDTHYHRLVRFSTHGEVLSMWGSKGTGLGEFIYPVAVTQDPNGLIYIGEYGGNDRVQVFSETGTPLRQFGSFGTDEGQFQRCSGLAFLNNQLFVADAINNRVHVYTPEGERMATYGDVDGLAFRFPYDITVTAAGHLAVIEYSAGRVTVMNAAGHLVARYGTTGRGQGGFATPWGIAACPKGRLYIADTGNHRLVVLKP